METAKTHKAYFFSDVHLGVPDYESSLAREKKLVKWLDSIKHEASDIFILGDLFDMWFDFKRVIPRGYVRLLGKFAELTDSGINIHYFTGNHDMWVFDYFKKELNLKIYTKAQTIELMGKSFFLGHGDGIGDGDRSYKFIKRIFSSKTNQWLFARLHPNFGLGLAHYFSKKSRISNGNFEEYSDNLESEILVKFCKRTLKSKHYDYFVFGHRHIAIDLELQSNSKYINLGEWVRNPHYAVFDGKNLKLEKVTI